MDLAYDHIAEQTYSGDRAATPTPPKDSADATTPKPSAPRQNLQTEFQETFKAFSNSPWGAKLGGIWGNVRKQGESYYEEARKEAEAASNEALKGFTGLKEQLASKTRSMSTTEKEEAEKPEVEEHTETTNDAKLQENDTFIARFKLEAARRLKEVQKAEDAADEALLRFGTNIRNFLQDAISVAPPEDSIGATEVLFESKDPFSGKRVIHSSRLDAQLHIINTSLSGFTEDPSGSGDQFKDFKDALDIEKKTDAITADLEKYPDLRRSMEKLVPEKVDYKDFWIRYYFLRHVVEAQEERRKELLKATANDTEEVAWDEDSDDENTSATPQTQEPKILLAQNTNDSSTTIHKTPAVDTLKPEGRRSHDEKSVAGSDASYDLISGATSRAPPSPKDDNVKPKAEESDEEDWE